MKEYILREKGVLQPNDRVIEMDENSIKVKVTKAAIAYFDIMMFNGQTLTTGIVPLRHAVGIISDPQASTQFSRGERVYLDPYKPCDNCYYCKTDQKRFCTNLVSMGKNADGFLTEFIKMPEANLVALPDNVTDEQALFIEPIASAITIIDRLDIAKGDHIVIFGSSIVANILCQLALYYQAVPILVDNNDINVDAAKKCGVYYTITNDAEAPRRIAEITGGRLAEKLVYFATSRFSPKYIFATCGYGANVVLTGHNQGNISLNYHQALEKQLNVNYVSNGFGNIFSAINMLVTKAVQVSSFIKGSADFADIEVTFASLAEEDVNTALMYNTIIDI